MEIEKKLTKEFATRDAFLSLANPFGVLPNPDSILRKTGKTIETYRELKNDPHVWSCVQSRKAGVLSLDHTVVRNDSTAGVFREIKSILNGFDISGLMRDILEAPLFGYQPLEIIWEQSAKSGMSFIYPKSIIPKPQEWFGFDTNGALRFKRIGKPEGELCPPEKIVCVRFEASYINPYGHSLLSKCYWPVVFKNGGLKFWVKFTERYGMPMLIGQYCRGATTEEARKLAEELAEMTEDAVIVTPADVNIDFKEAARNASSTLFRDLIRHCNSEISKAILSQTLTTELEMGSYAAANTHFRIRHEVVLSDIKLVEKTINHIIDLVVKMNFGNVKKPEFKVVVNDSENSYIVERDTKLISTGAVKFSRNYWMKRYGFSEDEIE